MVLPQHNGNTCPKVRNFVYNEGGLIVVRTLCKSSANLNLFTEVRAWMLENVSRETAQDSSG